MSVESQMGALRPISSRPVIILPEEGTAPLYVMRYGDDWVVWDRNRYSLTNA